MTKIGVVARVLAGDKHWGGPAGVGGEEELGTGGGEGGVLGLGLLPSVVPLQQRPAPLRARGRGMGGGGIGDAGGGLCWEMGGGHGQHTQRHEDRGGAVLGGWTVGRRWMVMMGQTVRPQGSGERRRGDGSCRTRTVCLNNRPPKYDPNAKKREATKRLEEVGGPKIW